ncbi:MAG: aminotransferase class V-fold PLP-dependent enzyme [Gemmatimonadaceae bacterium]|nr:aminotransferase class V-fold PLP-dependent enzyme [Gemmatimonadaceae bacterium]
MRPSIEKEPSQARSEASVLAQLRDVEFARLDAERHVYVDYTGAGLYADSQVARHVALLADGVFGNPHSLSPASIRSSELVENARQRIHDYFRADHDEYVAIFTANASHALKLVGESYPFTAGDRFLLTFDNHNSVNGIREFARSHGAATTYVPLGPELRVEEEALNRELEDGTSSGNNLFAYPAQSNFSGVHHPLEWIERAQHAGWDVLLDAAAFVPTNRLDLSRWHPDFVTLSFYKMFGYPTGVGALMARRSALAKLHRPWFAGGTISVASVQADRHLFAPGAAAFEDGTLDYLGVPAIEFGFDVLERARIDTVHAHVATLIERLLAGLGDLRHTNGAPVLRIFGPRDGERRGATVALNFYRADGSLIDHRDIEARAAARSISLRTGCFCNPGAGESALRLSRGEIERCFPVDASGGGFEPFRQCIDPAKGTGAVRISFGLASNRADLDTVLAFATSLSEG